MIITYRSNIKKKKTSLSLFKKKKNSSSWNVNHSFKWNKVLNEENTFFVTILIKTSLKFCMDFLRMTITFINEIWTKYLSRTIVLVNYACEK